jgi:hypothetical protein
MAIRGRVASFALAGRGNGCRPTPASCIEFVMLLGASIRREGERYTIGSSSLSRRTTLLGYVPIFWPVAAAAALFPKVPKGCLKRRGWRRTRPR